MFTDLVPDPDTKYMVGWIYIGAIALLVLVNFVAMLVTLFQTVKEEYRRSKIEQQNLKKLKEVGIELEDDLQYKILSYFWLEWIYFDERPRLHYQLLPFFLCEIVDRQCVFLIGGCSIFSDYLNAPVKEKIL